MRTLRYLLWIGLVVSTFGCGDDDGGAPDSGNGPDGGVAPDGAVAPDAAVAPDGAIAPDADVGPDAAVGPDANTDTTPPSIVSTLPADGTPFVSAGASISVTFDEEIDTSSVTAGTTFTVDGGSPVSGSISFGSGNTVATFTPMSPLAEGTTYTVTITTGVTDLAGNSVVGAPVTWTFSTLPVVRPRYSVAPDWNDYARASDPATTCSGTEAGGYWACIHGGEARAVEVTGHSACTDLTATDSLGAFDWACDGSTTPVRMVSTGLGHGKNLSDLLSFSGTPGWATDSVTVQEGGVDLFTTSTSTWWANPVVENNAGGSLAAPGTVYVVTADPSAAYSMDANATALVVEPGVVLSGPGTSADVVSASSRSFVWIEGSILATGDDTAINWTGVKVSVMRNVSAADANAATRPGGITLYSDSNDNRLSNIATTNHGQYGLYLLQSRRNTLEDITATNCGSGGLNFNNRCYGNTAVNVTAANNQLWGVSFGNLSNDNSLANITAANNGTGVALFSSSDNNALSNVTSVNNLSYGVQLALGSHNTFSNVVAAHNGVNGVRLEGASSDNSFTGLLKVGNNGSDCYVAAESTNTGLQDDVAGDDAIHEGACLAVAPSDFTPVTGASLGTSFVGKVGTGGLADSTEDSVNPDDDATPGTVDYAALTAWTGFETHYRAWGKDGSAFPNDDHRRRWTTGTGRIWDWAVRLDDLVIRAVLARLSIGDAANTITHAWSDASTSTYLRDAVEIIGDGAGNDDALCESGERCLYTPNVSSYQGHGALQSAGAFTDGDTITGVELIEYSTNGR